MKFLIKNGPKIDPKLIQNWSKIDPKLIQNRLEIDEIFDQKWAKN